MALHQEGTEIKTRKVSKGTKSSWNNPLEILFIIFGCISLICMRGSRSKEWVKSRMGNWDLMIGKIIASLMRIYGYGKTSSGHWRWTVYSPGLLQHHNVQIPVYQKPSCVIRIYQPYIQGRRCMCRITHIGWGLPNIIKIYCTNRIQ